MARLVDPDRHGGIDEVLHLPAMVHGHVHLGLVEALEPAGLGGAGQGQDGARSGVQDADPSSLQPGQGARVEHHHTRTELAPDSLRRP